MNKPPEKGMNSFLELSARLNVEGNHLYPQVEAILSRWGSEGGKTTRKHSREVVSFCHCKWYHGNRRTQHGTKPTFVLCWKTKKLEITQWQVIINKGAALDTKKIQWWNCTWITTPHLQLFRELNLPRLLFYFFSSPPRFVRPALSSCEVRTNETLIFPEQA